MRFLPFLLVAALVALAAAQDKPAPKSDREALIGTWLVVEFHDDGGDKLGRLTGRSVNPKDKPELLPRLVFTAERCYVLRPSKAGWQRDNNAGITNVNWDTVKLDEKATPHKTIDITPFRKDENVKATLLPGIYELDGKKLRICYNETPNLSKGRRPTEYKSDGDMNMFVCEKISDEPLKYTEVSDPKPAPPKPKTPDPKAADPKPTEPA